MNYAGTRSILPVHVAGAIRIGTALYIRHMANARKERIKTLPHFIAGFVILLHGFNALEAHPTSALLFLFFGLLCLALAVLHHRIEHRWPYVPAAFHFIEAAVACIVLAEHLHLGKKYLPYADAFVIVMYVGVGVYRIVKIRKARMVA